MAVVKFILDNKTVIAVATGWIFSAVCSSMPPLPANAGYLLTWAHSFLQAAAGNINKVRGQGTVNGG